MTADLEQAEKVMLEHDKHPFTDKLMKLHKEKVVNSGKDKYSSLYSSFDQLKPDDDFPPGLNKVLLCNITQPYVFKENYCCRLGCI
jgi:hypothetical protein